MNEYINWDEAPEGFDLHISLNTAGYCIEDFAIDLGEDIGQLTTGALVFLPACRVHGSVIEKPTKEGHTLVDEDSLQGQLSSIGNLLHNVSCSIEDEEHQSTLGKMVTELWRLSELYKLTPEQKLRAKVWDTIAETGIRESDIDSITTDILEKFKLEEK